MLRTRLRLGEPHLQRLPCGGVSRVLLLPTHGGRCRPSRRSLALCRLQQVVHAHLHMLHHRHVLLVAAAQHVVLGAVDQELREIGLAVRKLVLRSGNAALHRLQFGPKFAQLIARASMRSLNLSSVDSELLARTCLCIGRCAAKGLVFLAQLLHGI